MWLSQRKTHVAAHEESLKGGTFFGLDQTQEVYEQSYTGQDNRGPSCQVATGIFSKYILLTHPPIKRV